MKNFIQTILITVVTLVLFTFKINAQTFNWAKYDFDWSIGFEGQPFGISVDVNGNSYIIGNFKGTKMFGNFSLAANGYQDIFIAKFDSSGNCIWATHAGSMDSYVYGQGITVDANGNSYITGSFNPSIKFGNIQLTEPNQGFGCFIARYDVNGNCIWAKQSGPNANTYTSANGIAVDANENCYITGHFQGAITFGNIQTTFVGSSNYFFIAKFDGNGNCIWARQDTCSNSNAYGQGISVDSKGNSYVTGYFDGIVKFGNTQLISSLISLKYNENFFVAKYDANGKSIWAEQNTGKNGYGYSISIDTIGNSYVTGQFQGAITLGSIQLNASFGDANVFIAKYDASGKCIWANQDIGTNNYAIGYGISTDKIGNSYVTGQFSGNVTLGNIGMIASNKDVFVAKYDTKGNCISANQTSIDNSSSQGNGISVDPNGNAYFTGYGNITNPNPGFLAKIISYPTIMLNTISVEFGQTAIRSSIKKTISIKNSSVPTLNISSVNTTTKRFTTNINNAKINGNDSLNITITFIPDTTGSFNDTLYIHNNSLTPLVKISLSGSSPIPLLTAEISKISFNPAAKGDSSIYLLKLNNNTINNLSITSTINNTKSFHSNITTPVTITANNNFVGSIVFKPLGFGTFTDTLKINSTGGNLKIPISGNCPNPSIVLNTSSLSFGAQEIHISTQKTISIKNSSISNIVIDSMYTSSKRFTANLIKGIINIKDSLNIIITFKSDTTGSFTDTLFIHNNTTTPLVKITLLGSTHEPTWVETNILPKDFELSQNYPNPFNPTTTINYSIPKYSFVTIKIYDILGREVATLVNENKPVGNYNIKFDGSKLVSGIYFYRMQAGNFVQTKKLLLLK